MVRLWRHSFYLLLVLKLFNIHPVHYLCILCFVHCHYQSFKSTAGHIDYRFDYRVHILTLFYSLLCIDFLLNYGQAIIRGIYFLSFIVHFCIHRTVLYLTNEFYAFIDNSGLLNFGVIRHTRISSLRLFSRNNRNLLRILQFSNSCIRSHPLLISGRSRDVRF